MLKKFYTNRDTNIPPNINEKIQAQLKRPQMISVEVKSYDPNKEMIICGWANRAVADRGKEIMPKECWDLENYLKNPVILSNHCQWELKAAIGVSQKVEPRDEGLWVEAQIGNPEAGHELTEEQKIARSLLAQGVLKSFSVGFLAHEWKWDAETETLTYIRAELLEISVVTIPMQQDSVIDNVKHFSPKREVTKSMDEELKKALEGIQTTCNSILEAVKSSTSDASAESDEAKKLRAENTELKSDKEQLEAELEKMHSALESVLKAA